MQKLTGEWNENQILQGKWVFPNGTIYEGQFKGNKPNGNGIFLFFKNIKSLKLKKK